MRSLGVVALVLVGACSKGSSATPQKQPLPSVAPKHVDPAMLAAPALYQQMCSPCHGADAKGYKADHAPSLVNATFLESATDEYIHRAIALGRPGTSMAAYAKESGGPLHQPDIDKLVAWLRAQGSPVKQLPAAAPGDAKQGAVLYEKDCQKCHGTAMTRGEGVYLANPRFLESATDSYIRYAIVHGRPGTPMEPWQGKLSDKDIDDVVAFVRSFATQTTEQQLPAPTGKEPLVLNPHGKDPVFTLTSDPGNPDKRYVSAVQVKKALEDKRKLIIIDARPPSEWMRVHITGAVSIPYHDMKRLDEMPKDGTWAVAYCACPHHLSGIVVDELRRRGYAHSAVLDEGILEWHRRGYPVVAAPGVKPPPKELGR
ncbi:MAG: c-type cytochrome [Acidobacteriota bacterium]